MSDILTAALVLIPISIIGIWRWVFWLLRIGAGKLYRPLKEEALWPNRRQRTTVSVVTPVYNEDHDIFDSAMQSWINNGVTEIIAVVDKTNTRHIVNFMRKYSKHNEVKCRLVVTPKPGKRAALCDGIARSKGDIVALVDSDTVWGDDVLKKTLPYFSDKAIGGATVGQRILNPKSIGDILFDILLWLRYREEVPFLMGLGKVVNTLSGRTAFYRREALLNDHHDNIHALRHEFFLGTRGISGDDKRLTHLIIEQDWHLAYVRGAEVYTPGLGSTQKFFKQRLRWTRNSWRADLRAVKSRWVFRHPALAVHMIDRFIQPFVMLLGPIAFVILISRQLWISAAILFNWWLLSRFVRTFGYYKAQPRRIIYLPAYIVYGYVNALVKIYALATTVEHTWATRWDKKRLVQGKRMLRRATPVMVGTTAVALFIYLPYSFVTYLHQYSGANISVPVSVSQAELIEPINLASHTPQTPKLPSDAVLPTGVKRYTVKEGDTLSAVANEVNFAVQDLKKINGIQDPDKINRGDVIIYY